MAIPTIEDYLKRPAHPESRKGGIRINDKLYNTSPADKPLVSIFTVVFNCVTTLEDTILSVLQQTYENIEYIVIDGSSTDGTVDIIRKYEKQIDYWVSEPDEGLYDALNKGVAACNGNLVGLIHAGDIYTKNAISEAVDIYLGSDKNSIITGICIKFLNEERKVLEYPNLQRLPYRTIPHPSTFVPMSVYRRVGLFKTSFRIAGDYDFFCRCYIQSISFIDVEKILAIAQPAGLSSNYYFTEAEQWKVRIDNGLSPFKSFVLTLWSFSKITVHRFLEFFHLWNFVENILYTDGKKLLN